MNRMIKFGVILCLALAGWAAPATAQMDGGESPEWFNLELHIGPYVPDVESDVFDTVFGNKDRGPAFGLQFGFHAYHIPYVGPIGVGVGFSRATYEADSFVSGSTDTRSGETTSLALTPLHAYGFLRIETLARELGIPFVLVGKLGWDAIIWNSETGTSQDGSGVAQGLRWGAQLALELDFLEPRAARRLDSDWGVNHAYVFFEYFGSSAGGDITLGATSYSAGLGFQF